MTARKPIVINGGSLEQLQSGDTLPISAVDGSSLIEVRQDLLYGECRAGGSATATLSTGRGYFTFIGRITADITVNYVCFYVSSAGSGAQTAEVAIYSSTGYPSPSSASWAYSSAVLTPLASTGSLDSVTSTGLKRNTTAFGTAVSKGTYLWAGVRFAMVTTQPATLRAPEPNYLGYQQSGVVSALTTAGDVTAIGRQAITGNHPWIGVLVG